MPDGVDHELGGLVDAERTHDVGAVDRDGVRAEGELLGDLPVRIGGLPARSLRGLPPRSVGFLPVSRVPRDGTRMSFRRVACSSTRLQPDLLTQFS